MSDPLCSDELAEVTWAVPEAAGLEVAAGLVAAGLAEGLEFESSAPYLEFDSVLVAAETSSVDSSGIRNFALQ